MIRSFSDTWGTVAERACQAAFNGAVQLSALMGERLRLIQSQGFVGGWNLEIDLGSLPGRLLLLLDQEFPYSLPRVMLHPPPRPPGMPHVEENGLLCLGGEETCCPTNPELSIHRVLYDAVRLLSRLAKDGMREDFKLEFLSYWSRVSAAPPLYSLLTPDPALGHRRITAWRGEYQTLVADTQADLTHWFKNLYGEQKSPEDGLLIWLRDLPEPEEFPKHLFELLRILAKYAPESTSMLERLFFERKEALILVLAYQDSSGPVLLGIRIVAPSQRDVRKGFRRPNARQYLLAAARCKTGIKRHMVNRIDADWIHQRGGAGLAGHLLHRKVVIVGCGSLGAKVAQLLAQSGVGHLDLVDPDLLTFDNIGRHLLGAGWVRQNKAQAVGQALRKAYPHLSSVAGHPQRISHFLRDHGESMAGYDLIIDTTGSWPVTARLNAFFRETENPPPVIFSWLEPHAAACHAVAIFASGAGCIHCGMTPEGRFRSKVTYWEKDTLQREPACGGAYQPYGVIDLTFAQASVAGLAIEVLLGNVTSSTWRGWRAPRQQIENLGGRRTDSIALPDMGGSWEQPWLAQADCPACGASA